MSLYREDLRQSIFNYLQTEFPEFVINEEENSESYCFRLNKESSTHFVRVMYSAAGDDAEELSQRLEQYAVASTMRGLGDFPVVVTEQGCMFGSP